MSTRTGPAIEGGSIEPIVGSATEVKARRLEREIGTAAGTGRLLGKRHSQKLPYSIAPTCEHARYVIPRRRILRKGLD
jgi:hypothetical protein